MGPSTRLSPDSASVPPRAGSRTVASQLPKSSLRERSWLPWAEGLQLPILHWVLGHEAELLGGLGNQGKGEPGRRLICRCQGAGPVLSLPGSASQGLAEEEEEPEERMGPGAGGWVMP